MVCKRKPVIKVDFKLQLDLFMEKSIMTYIFIRYMPASMQNSLNVEMFFSSLNINYLGVKIKRIYSKPKLIKHLRTRVNT